MFIHAELRSLSSPVAAGSINYGMGRGGGVLNMGQGDFNSYRVELTFTSLSADVGIPGKDMRTHEHMAVSPEGTKLAFGAASGYIHVCDGRHRSWLTDVKMNRNVSALRFLTETVLVTGGQDSDLYVWDLRFNGRCLHRYVGSGIVWMSKEISHLREQWLRDSDVHGMCSICAI